MSKDLTKQFVIKPLIKLIVKLFGVASVFFGIVGMIDKMPTVIRLWKHRSEYPELAKTFFSLVLKYFRESPITPWLFTVVFVGGIIIFMIRLNLKNRGGRGGPISLISFIRRLNYSRLFHTLKNIHDLEHMIHRSEHQMIITPAMCSSLDNDCIRNLVGDLLGQCKETIRALTGADVAVHVKLFERNDTDPAGVTATRDAALKAYERVPADWEHEKNTEGTLPRRSQQEPFQIILGDEGCAKELSKRHSNGTLNGHKVNSAYNFVFDRNEHFWICNDLEKAKQEEDYFSTSANFERYYKSLAVFLVAHPIPAGDPVERDHTRGILAVDSMSKGCFERDLSRLLIGFLSHRLFEFFCCFERCHDLHLQTVKASTTKGAA